MGTVRLRRTGDAQTTDGRKMLALCLLGMVEALKTQEQDAAPRELSFLERLGLLWTNSGTGGRIKTSRLPWTRKNSRWPLLIEKL
jgi:hypothetical protein